MGSIVQIAFRISAKVQMVKEQIYEMPKKEAKQDSLMFLFQRTSLNVKQKPDNSIQDRLKQDIWKNAFALDL